MGCFMKCVLLILICYSAHIFANVLSIELPGKYSSVNCAYYSELTIYKYNNSLVVSAQRADSDFMAFSETVKLFTKGKKFDCTPGASYGDVQCQVRESRTSLIAKERGCMIFCGPWHLQLSIQKLSATEIGIKTSDDQTEACIFNRLPN